MRTRLHNHLRRFLNDEKGSVAVEAAVVLPVLLWAFVAMWVFFDAYRARTTVEKAAFTVSDMLSRETNAIDDDYLDGAKNLFDLLADSDSPSGLRVSVITYSGAYQEYRLEWSQIRGNINKLEDQGLSDLVDDLPGMSDGERLILVQTTSTYEPSLRVGIGDHTMKTFIFTRPRFAPQLVWSDT